MGTLPVHTPNVNAPIDDVIESEDADLSPGAAFLRGLAWLCWLVALIGSVKLLLWALSLGW